MKITAITPHLFEMQLARPIADARNTIVKRSAVLVRVDTDEGVTGGVFRSLDALVDGMPAVLALDRSRVRARAIERVGLDRMVDEHVEVYARLAVGVGA